MSKEQTYHEKVSILSEDIEVAENEQKLASQLSEVIKQGYFLEKRQKTNQFDNITKGFKNIKAHIKGEDIGEEVDEQLDNISHVKDELSELLDNTRSRVLDLKTDKLRNMAYMNQKEGSVMYDRIIPLSQKINMHDNDEDGVSMFKIEMIVSSFNRQNGLSRSQIKEHVNQEGDLIGIVFSSKEMAKKEKDLEHISGEMIKNLKEHAGISFKEVEKLQINKRIVDGYESGINDEDWASLSSKKKEQVYKAFKEESPSRKISSNMLSAKL